MLNLKTKAFDFEKKLLSNSDITDVILRMGSSAEDAQWGKQLKITSLVYS